MTWYKNVFQTDENGKPVLDENGKKIVVSQEKTFKWSEASGTDHHYNLGNSLPKVFGSIGTNLEFKGFDFYASLFYSIGGKMFDYIYNERKMYRIGTTGGPELLDRWTPDNTDTDVARLTVSKNQFGNNFSDWLLYDNSYFRLRNLTIGYSIPQKLASRLYLSNLRFYFSGANLFTWGPAAARNTEPEIQLNGVLTSGAGDFYEISTRKILTFGLQASF